VYRKTHTDVDVEIGIVNVEAVGSLLEVDMGHSIIPNIVVSNNPECGTVRFGLYQLSR
jgi:hypothetical protein